jgi:hypothetical protein
MQEEKFKPKGKQVSKEHQKNESQCDDYFGEIWTDINGYNGSYQISTLGRVRSFFKNNYRILRIGRTKNRYPTISLCNGSGCITHKIHRLVAESFIAFMPKMEVNHINGDKDDNNVSNLEWVTRSQNIKHSYDIGLRENQRKVLRRNNGKRKKS